MVFNQISEDRGAADKSRHSEREDTVCVKGDAAEGQGLGLWALYPGAGRISL